jgi:Ca2+-binding RTX toxin-like protein
VLRGTEEGDLILAGEYGEDEVYGLGGDDTIEGGACEDKVYGGPGIDDMVGEEGDDVLYGGLGNDKGFDGGSGRYVLYGGDGHDVLIADEDGQRDELYCGEGQDKAEVGEKIDYVDRSCEEKKHPTPAVA